MTDCLAVCLLHQVKIVDDPRAATMPFFRSMRHKDPRAREGACEKRHFLSHLYLKTMILPRQAGDKHRESSTQKKMCRFLAGFEADMQGMYAVTSSFCCVLFPVKREEGCPEPVLVNHRFVFIQENSERMPRVPPAGVIDKITERAKVKKQEQAAAEPEEEEVRRDRLLPLSPPLPFLSSGIVLPIQARDKRVSE